MTKTMELEYIDYMYNPFYPKLLVIKDWGKNWIAIKEFSIDKDLVFASKEAYEEYVKWNKSK